MNRKQMESCGGKSKGMSSGRSPTGPRRVVITPGDVNGLLYLYRERCVKSMGLARHVMLFSSEYKITF